MSEGEDCWNITNPISTGVITCAIHTTHFVSLYFCLLHTFRIEFIHIRRIVYYVHMYIVQLAIYSVGHDHYMPAL